MCRSLLTIFLSLGLFAVASAERMLKSTSLSTCQANSDFSASLFNVVYTPGNKSASIELTAVSLLEGKLDFDVSLRVYGYEAIRRRVDPCKTNLRGMCPMASGKLSMVFNIPIGDDVAKKIPGVAYTIPDLDATARIWVNLTSTGETVACVEAAFSNGKTVDLRAVKWTTGVIIALGLLSAAAMSTAGYTNASAHLASNTISLLSYFQAQAIISLTSVKIPPIVQAWTQNFVWSIGIIRIGWLQRVFTWYQRSTGGTPADLLGSLRSTSVLVQKRSFEEDAGLIQRGISALTRRANIKLDSGSYVVYGIQRVAFRAKMETTNVFLTSLTSFYCLGAFVALAVLITKYALELFAAQKWIRHDRFLDFRNGWLCTLKGTLFRITLISLAPLVILSLWEFTQRDSPAIVVLAVFTLLGITVTVGWATFRIVTLARQSIARHQNPAYLLFANPRVLETWGCLYIQFRASAYYYTVPMFAYVIVKGSFVAFGQHTGITQAIALIIIEFAPLIAATVLQPWMDKSTNAFNIAICVLNAFNSILLLILSDIFGAPGLVAGVSGVVLFVANAAFALVLLIMVIVSSVIAFWRKNPDTKYQRMHDDRVSFMKSQSQLGTTSELNALSVVARSGEEKSDDHDPSKLSHLTAEYQSMASSQRSQSRSSADPSVPLVKAST